MKEQDIRIAMAEIDGIKDHGEREGYFRYYDGKGNNYWNANDLPNYPQDLNAIAALRKRHLNNTKKVYWYLQNLFVITGADWLIPESIYLAVDATELQHCEALIKTLAPEKWKED